MLIEAAKGGHTNVVQLLLDYPHSIMMRSGEHSGAPAQQVAAAPAASTATGLHDVPEAVRAHHHDETKSQPALGKSFRFLQELRAFCYNAKRPNFRLNAKNRKTSKKRNGFQAL